jgi:hypothetical protein
MEYNISISLFSWIPPSPLKMNPPPTLSDMRLRCADVDFFTKTQAYDTSFVHSFDNIAQFLESIVRPIQADLMAINQGFWTYHALNRSSDTEVEQFVKVIKSASKRSLWKTSTPHRWYKYRKQLDSDEFISKLKTFGLEIFDAYSLLLNHVVSKYSRKTVYADFVHFYPEVYSLLNKLLLSLLLTPATTSSISV